MLEKTYSFAVTTKSELSGKLLEGTFTVRRPTLADLGAISAAVSRLNQGEPFSSMQLQTLLTAVATIKVCADATPDWWAEVSGLDDNPIDTRVVFAVWSRLTEARDRVAPFRPGVQPTETGQETAS